MSCLVSVNCVIENIDVLFLVLGILISLIKRIASHMKSIRTIGPVLEYRFYNTKNFKYNIKGSSTKVLTYLEIQHTRYENLNEVSYIDLLENDLYTGRNPSDHYNSCPLIKTIKRQHGFGRTLNYFKKIEKNVAKEKEFSKTHYKENNLAGSRSNEINSNYYVEKYFDQRYGGFLSSSVLIN